MKRHYKKIPESEIMNRQFQESIQLQMKDKYNELLTTIVLGMGNISIEDLQIVYSEGTAKQSVYYKDKHIGNIDFSFGHHGDDFINNQITARWTFTETPYYREMASIAKN